MAANFFTKTQISLGNCLEIDGSLALEQYAALQNALAGQVSPQAAALFAEPLVSKGNAEAAPTVSWYTDLDGDGGPIGTLDDTALKAIETKLSGYLREIKPLLDDSDDGRLIAAALHIKNPESIWSIRGEPILLDWGMLPEGVTQTPQARQSHFNSTLGRFLPLGAAPPITAEEQAARKLEKAAAAQAETPSNPAMAAGVAGAAGAAGAAAGATAATAAQTPPPPPPHTTERRNDRVPLYAWLPLLLLLLLFGGVLVWLLIPGTRLFQPQQVAIIDDAQAVQLTEQVNRDLQERLDRLQAAVDGAQCLPDGTLTVPGGLTIEGLLPPGPNEAPGDRAEANPQPILPPDPARTLIPSGGETDPLSQPRLLALLEDRTVMIVTTLNGRVGSIGSGFFISPNAVVTNLHVIDGMEQVFITNRSLGKVHQAQVLKTMGPFNSTGGDYALLQVPGLEHAYYNVLQSEASLKLQSVIAAGYPGDVLGTDAKFAALRAGDANAVPDMTLTDGVVNTEQALSPTSSVVVHSAPMSKGNSGGPLVDMCGRVIGVNTFVRQGNMRNLNIALSTDGLVQFLEGSGIRPDVVSQACVPQLTRPAIERVAQAPTDTVPSPESPDAPAIQPLPGTAPADPSATPPAPAPGAIPNFAAPTE
ncbi:MAG: serine protease [Pseudomonadota bacterium]